MILTNRFPWHKLTSLYPEIYAYDSERRRGSVKPGRKLETEGYKNGLQTVRPSRGSDDHVEMAVPSPVGDVK